MTLMQSMRTMVDGVRSDGWENVILGLGGTKDPSVYTTFAPTRVAGLSESVLEALYVEDHFAATIVEALPLEALRPGWDLEVNATPEEVAKIRDAYRAREDELCVAQEISQGACWGRLFGGAVTWIGADDGRDPSLPLDEKRIATVKFLHTFDRRDVQPWSYYQDPSHPKFRKPETYLIRPSITTGIAAAVASIAGGRDRTNALFTTAAGAVVHESRCVVWGGTPTTDRRRLQLAGWEDSVLERCWDALRQVGEDYGSKSMLLGRVSQAVYKILNLWKLLASKEKDVLEQRMALLEASRSRARAILLDTKEDFANVAQPLAGVNDMITQSVVRLASAARMPVSVLMQQASPTGLNAGQSDELELWSAKAEEYRAHQLRPRHEKITRCILLSKDFAATSGKEPENWSIAYRPLRTPAPKELAEERKIVADTAAVYIDKGLAKAEQLAVQLFSPSSAMRTGFTLDEADLRAALERGRELASQPPKDNAELGTVAPRVTTALESVVMKANAKEISRETALAALRIFYRLSEQDALDLLGPEDFAPAKKPSPPTPPGPAPGPGQGSGAGAPPGLPGVNVGGDPTKENPIKPGPA